ncbi:unnamed protein product [Pedinophyceae sp. YPF-701]|nr:unnamed protein product [Pedinophyceae sp. YPF-701]
MSEENVMRIGRRCYVSNLAWKTSWQDLKDAFSGCGNVVYSAVAKRGTRSKGWGIIEFELPEEAAKAVAELNGTELDGRPIVVREDREDRDLVAYNQANGIESPQRPRRRHGARDGLEGADGLQPTPRPPRAARPPQEPRAPAVPGEGECTGKSVMVKHIPWAFDDDALAEHFAELNPVSATVKRGKDDRSRGYGTVLFADTDAAASAIEKFDGAELDGRKLAVAYDRFA